MCSQRRLRSAWESAQADLSLRWAHCHFFGFVMRQLNFVLSNIVITSLGEEGTGHCWPSACVSIHTLWFYNSSSWCGKGLLSLDYSTHCRHFRCFHTCLHTKWEFPRLRQIVILSSGAADLGLHHLHRSVCLKTLDHYGSISFMGKMEKKKKTWF